MKATLASGCAREDMGGHPVVPVKKKGETTPVDGPDSSRILLVKNIKRSITLRPD